MNSCEAIALAYASKAKANAEPWVRYEKLTTTIPWEVLLNGFTHCHWSKGRETITKNKRGLVIETEVRVVVPWAMLTNPLEEESQRNDRRRYAEPCQRD